MSSRGRRHPISLCRVPFAHPAAINMETSIRGVGHHAICGEGRVARGGLIRATAVVMMIGHCAGHVSLSSAKLVHCRSISGGNGRSIATFSRRLAPA